MMEGGVRWQFDKTEKSKFVSCYLRYTHYIYEGAKNRSTGLYGRIGVTIWKKVFTRFMK